MKKLTLLSVALFAVLSTGCTNNEERILVVDDSDAWHTFIEGSDFNADGLEVYLQGNRTKKMERVEFEVENGENLTADQTSVTLKHGDYTLEYPITVKKETTSLVLVIRLLLVTIGPTNLTHLIQAKQ